MFDRLQGAENRFNEIAMRLTEPGVAGAVSYTHLDVYKRQV